MISRLFFLTFFIPSVILIYNKPINFSELLLFFYLVCDYLYFSIKSLNLNFILFIGIIIFLDTIIQLIVKIGFEIFKKCFYFTCEKMWISVNLLSIFFLQVLFAINDLKKKVVIFFNRSTFNTALIRYGKESRKNNKNNFFFSFYFIFLKFFCLINFLKLKIENIGFQKNATIEDQLDSIFRDLESSKKELVDKINNLESGRFTRRRKKYEKIYEFKSINKLMPIKSMPIDNQTYSFR